MLAARKALLQLVRAKDDVADYWAELGKLQASMGSYGDAYYAFTRAYELDRSNPQLLRALTELALRSGDVGLAQTHARELAVVAPGDPWVKLVEGWAAIGESRFDKALAVSDGLLAISPYDSAAITLKGRALIGLNREDDAIDALVKQLQAQPTDLGTLQLLARIYDGRGDWTKLADVAQRLVAVHPEDPQSGLTFIRACLRSGAIEQARQASFKLLRPDAPPDLVSSVLELWALYWPSPRRIEDARMLANAASGQEQRLLYLAFLTRAGSPADALRLAGSLATLPVTAKNAEANAVLADAMSRTGNLRGAKARFDAVIAFDPGNATALRGRSELELRTANARAAIQDAQKLTTVLPNSSSDRLLLSRAYAASGDRAWAERTLWAAFQDIPADERIYAALRAAKSGNIDAMNDLQAEFARQRGAKVRQGLL
jgi:predicted Zn-dependent protease